MAASVIPLSWMVCLISTSVTWESMDGIELLRLLGEGVSLDLSEMVLRVDAVEASGIEAKDLALVFLGHIHAKFGFEVFRHLEGPQFLNKPLGFPEGIVTAEEHFVGTNPEEQVGHDFGEVTRTGLDKGQHDGQTRIDIALLGGNP